MILKRFRHFDLFIFAIFTVAIFIVYASLFGSYFEADEWFHYSYYFPLTRKDGGFIQAILSTFLSSGELSAGQHVVPIASAIYFLNTKFFGLNYYPYAFASLFLHSINSFLVFFLIKTLLKSTPKKRQNIFGVLGGILFAFSPASVHAITGAAPFYGQNILSVTFFLLCLIFFKQAFNKKNKKFIFISVVFLFLSVLSKETSIFLFAILPLMAFLEKRVFSFKFLSKLFLISVIIYSLIRFLIPGIYSGSIQNKLADVLLGNQLSVSTQNSTIPKDTGTIISRDTSIYKNLPAEIILRSVTFPIRMTGNLFIPRTTHTKVVMFISPVFAPTTSLGDYVANSAFVYGSGSYVVIYAVSLIVIFICLKLRSEFINRRKSDEAKAIVLGLAIIFIGSLPLVLIVLSFPRWGFDSYFDSRLNYNPNVGAAIIFPFLIIGISQFFHNVFKKKIPFKLISSAVFILWFINNFITLQEVIVQFTKNYQPDRREVVRQLKEYVPALPKITVFYFETDERSAYGPILPFQTGVPQALSLVYYETSPLPDSFFNKPLFNEKKEGYEYKDGRGFGYYISKENLLKDLKEKKFKVSDIHAFYYQAEKVKLNNITPTLRKEIENKLSVL